MNTVKIIKQTSTVNTTSAPGRHIDYIVIHYTASTRSRQGTARAIASQFANPGRKASADFIVDDKEIVQYNPDIRNRYTWAVGGQRLKTKGGALYGKAKNANTINIELCSSNRTGKMQQANDNMWYFTSDVITNGIELVRKLMKEYNLDITRVIRHYDVTGKYCPGIVGWNIDSGNEALWIAFKNLIIEGGKIMLNESKEIKPNPGELKEIEVLQAEIKAEKKEEHEKQENNDIKPFLVRVITTNLNIRRQPSLNAPIACTATKGVYTIVAVHGDFGLLKAYEKGRNGWIKITNPALVERLMVTD